MALSCSRRKYSRCIFSISDWASVWILRPSSSTSSSLSSSAISRRSFSSAGVHLQQFLRIRQVDADVGGDGVDQLQRVFHVERRVDQLAGDAGHQIGQAPELLDHVAHQRLDFERFFDRFRGGTDPRPQIRFGAGVLTDPDARQALHQQADRAIRGAEQAVNLGHRADA